LETLYEKAVVGEQQSRDDIANSTHCYPNYEQDLVMMDNERRSHVCPRECAPECSIYDTGNEILVQDVSVSTLIHFGSKTVRGYVRDSQSAWYRRVVTLLVHDVRQAMLSTGVLEKLDIATHIEPSTSKDDSYFVDRTLAGHFVFPLCDIESHIRLRFYCWKPEKIVAPMEDTDRREAKRRREKGDRREMEAASTIGDMHLEAINDGNFPKPQPSNSPPPASGAAAPVARPDGSDHMHDGDGRRIEPPGPTMQVDEDNLEENLLREQRMRKPIGGEGKGPTAKECAEHELTAWPCRTRCGWCVSSHVHDSPHQHQDQDREFEHKNPMSKRIIFSCAAFGKKSVRLVCLQ